VDLHVWEVTAVGDREIIENLRMNERDAHACDPKEENCSAVFGLAGLGSADFSTDLDFSSKFPQHGNLNSHFESSPDIL